MRGCGWNECTTRGFRKVLREQRIGCRDGANIDVGNFRIQGRVHPIYEDIRQQGVAGVGRMNAVKREKSTKEREAGLDAIDCRRAVVNLRQCGVHID